MSKSKVSLPSLSSLALRLQNSSVSLFSVKTAMDESLASFIWDDPVAINFKNEYQEKLKPVENKLIPALDNYVQYIQTLIGTVSEYSGESSQGLSFTDSLLVAGGLTMAGAAVAGNAMFGGAPALFASSMWKNASKDLEKEGKKNEDSFMHSLSTLSDEELKQKEKEWRKYEDYAILSDVSYNDGEASIPQGYHLIGDDGTDSDLADYISQINLTASTSSIAPGFQCQMFKDDNGKYILAFRGTDELADIKTDAIGALLKDESQAVYAREATTNIINILKEKPGFSYDNLIVTGHSLGGRLAQEAAFKHGLQAVVFNSADLSSGTKSGLSKYMDLQRVVKISSSEDVLTTFQRTSAAKKIIGREVVTSDNIHILPNAGTHKIGPLSKSIAERHNLLCQELKRRGI